jgi:excisionase family DNA binding protein
MSRLLLVHEVAELLRVSPSTVYDLVHEGRLKARRVRERGKLLFDPGDVRDALRAAGPALRGVAPAPGIQAAADGRA